MRWLCIAALLLASGCGDEGLNPVPKPPVTTEPTAEPHPPAGPIVRTVETRNPWGGPPANLLVDGDFEFSIVLEGSSPQAGWTHFYSSGLGAEIRYLRGLTGGACKSGLRCAVIPGGGLGADSGLLGKGTSAKDKSMVGEAWAKLPAGSSCASVSFLFYHCSFNSNFGRLLLPVADAPDADGWCQYRGGIEEQDESMCVQITNTLPLEQEVVIDAVSLLPDDGTATHRSIAILDEKTKARLRELTKKLRDRTPLGAAPAERPLLADGR